MMFLKQRTRQSGEHWADHVNFTFALNSYYSKTDRAYIYITDVTKRISR